MEKENKTFNEIKEFFEDNTYYFVDCVFEIKKRGGWEMIFDEDVFFIKLGLVCDVEKFKKEIFESFDDFSEGYFHYLGLFTRESTEYDEGFCLEHYEFTRIEACDYSSMESEEIIF